MRVWAELPFAICEYTMSMAFLWATPSASLLRLINGAGSVGYFALVSFTG